MYHDILCDVSSFSTYFFIGLEYLFLDWSIGGFTRIYRENYYYWSPDDK